MGSGLMQRSGFVRALGLVIVLVLFAAGCGGGDHVAPEVSAEISKARAEGHKSVHQQLKKTKAGDQAGEASTRKKAFSAAHKGS
jgi:hypothetical protein